MSNKSCCIHTDCKRNGNCFECMTYHRDRDSLTRCQKDAKKSGIIVRKPTAAEIIDMEAKPTWNCGISVFDWFYDSEETCLITEGEATVEFAETSVSFGAGDYVVFRKGLSCVWKVTKPVKKHYIFK